MIPQYRIEQYLAAIKAAYLGESPLPEHPALPVWRIEYFLAAILSAVNGDSPVMACPDPAWKLEEFGRAIYDAITAASPAWPCPVPTSNLEAILHAIYVMAGAGDEEATPSPSWDIERWLLDVYDAAKEGSGTEKTVSGALIHITDALAKAAKALVASVATAQDLHGYSKPWPAGGNVNVMPGAVAKTESANGVTISTTGDGVYTLTGTASDTMSVEFDLTDSFVIPPSSTHKCLFKNEKNSGSTTFAFYNGSTQVDSWGMTPINRVGDSYQAMGNKTCNRVRIAVGAGTVTNYTISPMFVLQSVASGVAFSPCANICPITGLTGLTVYVGPDNDPDNATAYAFDWTSPAGTVYGGSLDLVTGVLTVTHIGTALPASEPTVIGTYSDRKDCGWNISDKAVGLLNVMAEGFETKSVNGVPPIGCVAGRGANTYVTFGVPIEHASTAADAGTYIAQNTSKIVYELATPLTYQLTAQEVELLLGENYLWRNDSGDLQLTYYADGNANTEDALNLLLGNRYVNNHTPDDVSDREALGILLGR